MDLLERRVLKGETIPHEEKVFSIFEPYTEWSNKGKVNPSVELGKRVLITSDQYDLIVDWQVMEKIGDAEALKPLADRVLEKHQISSWSFDKGFWSPENYKHLSARIDLAILPKKGRLNEEEHTREHTAPFLEGRRKHSAA